MSTRSRPPTPRRQDRGRARYRFTAEQVLRMVAASIFADGDDVELWNGVIYRMVKGELHNAVVTQVAAALRPLAPPGHQVREEKSCSADPRSLPEPDVMIYKGGPWDHVDSAPPPLSKMELLVEVDHHTDSDFTAKLAKYARAGVPCYWVVDVKRRQVVVFTRPLGPDAGRYAESRTFAPGDAIDVVLDGQARGSARVDDFLPPEEIP